MDGLEGSERTAADTTGFSNGGTDLDENGVDDYDIASLQQRGKSGTYLYKIGTVHDNTELKF